MSNKRFKKIYIEITNICNLSCEFCMPDNRKKEYMSEEKFTYILNQIKPYTEYIYLHVKGEPLIHPLINNFIDIANKEGFNVNLTTNGTLIDRLESKNIRQINYSMQSGTDVNVVRDIIRKIKDFIKDTNIYLSLRLWTEKSKLNNELKEMLVKEFDLIDNINDIQNKKKIDENVFLSIESEFDWPDLENDSNCDKGYCYGLRDQIAILVNGTVVPCCLDHKGNINLGNIYNKSLDEILNTKRAQDILIGFQNRKIVEELCKKCTFKNKF